MDTTAYLTQQGWLGSGHALHPTGRGIRKPLLVSQKPNVLGIGKKKHDAYADQWWARAFDNSLKGLEVGKHGITGATESVKFGTWGVLDMIKAGEGKSAGTGDLYAGFVRGEGLSGTMVPEKLAAEESDLGITKEADITVIVKRLSRNRRRTALDQRAVDAKAERLNKEKEAATTSQADFEGGKMTEDSDTILKTLSSKEERRQRRKERRSREARGAEIVRPVFRPDLSGPKLGKRTRKKDGAGVLGSSQELIVRNSPENENGW
ncbi:hypothetical protein MMC17_009501 [Xylographa soralifera]|nr:hypothetical protein [Xylographa soralifera]